MDIHTSYKHTFILVDEDGKQTKMINLLVIKLQIYLLRDKTFVK